MHNREKRARGGCQRFSSEGKPQEQETAARTKNAEVIRREEIALYCIHKQVTVALVREELFPVANSNR